MIINEKYIMDIDDEDDDIILGDTDLGMDNLLNDQDLLEDQGYQHKSEIR